MSKKGVSTLGLSILAFGANVAATDVRAETLVAINSQDQIGVFETSNPASISYTNLTGLMAGESFLGIDLRPSNNTLYGVTTLNNLYTVDAFTGVASLVAALSSAVALGGIGIDFNPVADRGTGASLRVVNTAGGNFAINVNTGVVTVATPVSTGFFAVAYSNSDPTNPTVAPTDTQLYYLSSSNDTLSVATSSFNSPTITLVGALGFDVLSAGGFELFSNGNAYAAVNADDGLLKSRLFSINLATGAADELGQFLGTAHSLAAAPSPIPLPATLPLIATALGLLGMSTKRRKSAPSR